MSDTTTALTAPASARRTELDAVRTALVLGLILFHSALVFDTNDDFYVTNDETIELTGLAAGPIIVWAMPLLFAIAGIAAPDLAALVPAPVRARIRGAVRAAVGRSAWTLLVPGALLALAVAWLPIEEGYAA